MYRQEGSLDQEGHHTNQQKASRETDLLGSETVDPGKKQLIQKYKENYFHWSWVECFIGFVFNFYVLLSLHIPFSLICSLIFLLLLVDFVPVNFYLLYQFSFTP